MRCNHCGFINQPNRNRCEQCNAPLTGSIIGNPYDENLNNTNGDIFSNTIKGANAITDPWDCPNCGRPVIPGSDACNQCGYVFRNNKPNFKNAEPVIREKTFPDIQNGINPKKTIDPYSKGFILKPIAKEFDNELSEIIIKVDLDEIQVGREKLEPENMTISSKQAIFLNRNGKWYVKDISSNKTTYVYCADFIEIKDGDIILMGNRKFVFKE